MSPRKRQPSNQPAFDFGPPESGENRPNLREGLLGEDFDLRVKGRATPTPAPVLAGRDGWQEVPQALFLSWSEARQLDYCARRDEDAAEHEDSDFWRKFYVNRAGDYRQQLSEAQ